MQGNEVLAEQFEVGVVPVHAQEACQQVLDRRLGKQRRCAGKEGRQVDALAPFAQGELAADQRAVPRIDAMGEELESVVRITVAEAEPFQWRGRSVCRSHK
ncbi:Uncharacterised protein [Acinetobacter baumannii]|nr:Uncharacterised protein [Acinetobacter baumannii]